MATVILFGGGDGGGIIIDEHGVHRIPPYGPPDGWVSQTIRSAVEATKAIHTLRENKAGGNETVEFLQAFADKAAHLVVEHVEKQVAAQISGHVTLVSMEDDDVIVCGTPYPHPVVIHGPTPFGQGAAF